MPSRVEQPVTSVWLTRVLLGCGAVAGPLFILTVLVQDYTRSDFDPRTHPLSMLSLGELGWIQITIFVVTGLLNLAFAVGLWRVLPPGHGEAWGPLLIGAYGIGLVGAGIFVGEPGLGYPPGAPPGIPEDPGWSFILHGVSGIVAFGSLVAACFVFSRRFGAQRERWWTVYSAVTGVVVLALFLLAGDGEDPQRTSLLLRAATFLGWGWASALAVRLRGTLGRSSS